MKRLKSNGERLKRYCVNVRARGVTKAGEPIFPEWIEQVWVAEWLTAKGIFFTASANGELRHKAVAKKLKRMGVLPGVSDIIIFDPPPKFRDRKGVVLELKALDGDEPTENQREFLRLMHDRYWLTHWDRGSDAAIKWLESVGY